ncbi:MAG: lipid-A-disaccharide synthase [bacterium]
MKAERPLTILLAAIEPSGDALGAALYKNLQNLIPEGSKFIGCGGQQMAAAGFVSSFDVDAFAVMGFTDVIKVIPEGMKRAKQLALLAAQEKADIAIFIDGWTFSRVGSKRIKKYSPDTFIVKYAAPQIWASRPQRIDFVKKYFDAVLTLLPFETANFEKAGIAVSYTGNSNYTKVRDRALISNFIPEKYNLKQGKTLVILPGSRKGEVTKLAPAYIETAQSLQAVDPDLNIVLVAAPNIKKLTQDLYAPLKGAYYIEPEDRYDVFAMADAALATSGTVATELAILKTPMIVAYKVDALTYFWAKRVMITNYITILNIAKDQEIIPEYIQDNCIAEKLVPALSELLYNQSAKQQQIEAVAQAMPLLGMDTPNPAKRAAEECLRLFKQYKSQ